MGFLGIFYAGLLLLMGRPEARAQTMNPPVKQWQVAYNYAATNTACSSLRSNDWSYNITPTRDGGYISAGYSRIKAGTDCSAGLVTSPTLTKYTANGQVVWHRIYQSTTMSGIARNTRGALREVVELADGSGYLAAGYKLNGSGVQQMYVVKVNLEGLSPTEYHLSISGSRASRGYSVREVLKYTSGVMSGDGFIIGGTALDSSGSSGTRRLCMIRLSSTYTVSWRRTFRNASPLNGGLTEGVVRPLYSGGTIHTPTRTLVAERPDASGATLVGFAIVGNGVRSSDQESFDYYSTIVEGASAESTDSAVVAARTALAGFNEFDVYVARTKENGELGQQTNYAGTWEYWAADQTDNIRHCSTAGESYTDLGMDLEQLTGSDDFIASAIFNVAGGCTGWTPFFNEGDADLLKFDPGTATPTISPTFIHHFSGIEWFPNVVPTPDGGYALTGSTKENLTAANKTQGYLWKGTSSLTTLWEKYFYGVGDDLCAFGLGLTTDGGYVVSGNNDATTTRDQDEVVVKLSNDCQTNYAYDLVAPSGDYKIHGTVTWNSSNVPSGVKTVRGTIRIMAGAQLIIDGIRVEFADTRQTVDVGSFTTRLSETTRIIINPGVPHSPLATLPDSAGGVLKLLNGARLTGLPTDCNSNNMWDGVVIRGLGSSYAQSNVGSGYHGEVRMEGPTGGYASIEEARYGLLAGRTTYSNTGSNLVGTVNAEGGGVILATRGKFLNCYQGVVLTPWDLGTKNVSGFNECLFQADAPLADHTYNEDGVRYGTQAFVRIYGTAHTQFRGNTFKLLDGTSTAFGQVLPQTLRGAGIYANDGSVRVGPTAGAVNNRFENLQFGIVSSNTDRFGYTTRVVNAEFVGNVGGIYLTASANPALLGNRFEIGRNAELFSYGVSLYNSSGFQVEENNFFSAQSRSGSDPYYLARGLNVTLSDDDANPDQLNPVYRNYFAYLGTGIYGQRGNQRLLLRCNRFRGPSGTTTQSLTRADIEVAIGTASQTEYFNDPQGICGNTTFNPPADNELSHSCGSAKDILLSGNAGSVNYWYHNANSDYVPSSGCYTSTKLTPNSCSASSNGYDNDCPSNPIGQESVGDIVATLDTLTDPAARALLIDELLRRYLSEDAYEHGLDSAIALLQGLDESSYAAQLAALEAIAGGGSSSRAAGPGRGELARARRANPAGGSAAETADAAPDYFEQVRALLAPLGPDSAITAELLTNATLRGQLEAIAGDTTTWGYAAGQAALSRYLGYRFGPWYEASSTDGGAAARGAAPLRQAAEAPTATVAQFYPNPTTGEVRIAYALPDGVTNATLTVRDALGRPVLTQELKATSGDLWLNLNDLPNGVFAYGLTANGRLLQAGKVVKVP